jgi:hypothetical protein
MRSQWFHARLDATIHDHAKADAMTASRLFFPITLRGLTLDNRIVLSPMCQYASQDGNPSPWHTVHLGTYALANLGLAITEATAVEPAGRISPMCLGLYSDAHQEALAHIKGPNLTGNRHGLRASGRTEAAQEHGEDFRRSGVDSGRNERNGRSGDASGGSR